MATWHDINRQIIDTIDLAAEYRSMGLDIAGAPGPGGWASCRCFGREDRSPSAGVNLTGEHPLKGRYKEFTGEARNLSFFEFAAVAGKFPDWKAARDHYRKAANIKAPKGKQPRTLDEQFAWLDYNEALIRSWCSRKPPIAHWAVRIAGGRLAQWHFGHKPITVVVLPVFGPHGADADPCGYVYWALGGGTLPAPQGRGKGVLEVKMKTALGSEAGLMNRYGLSMVSGDKVEAVWKVEGPGDMLALQSVIPRELLERHIVLTNSGGSMQNPREWEVARFAGKRVFVLHDRDKDGTAGGLKWATAIATVAAEVRHVELPYPLADSHGKDVRDWLCQQMETEATR